MSNTRRLPSRLALAIGFFLLICSAVSLSWLNEQERSADGWVRHTYSVEAALNQAQMHTMRAEIGRRGFLLLGTSESLATYTRARAALPKAIASVERLTVDNPRQSRRVAALHAVIMAKLVGIDQSIALRRSGDLVAASALVGNADARAATAHMLAVVAAIHDEESRLLAERQGKAADYESLARAALTASILLMLILALFVSRERRERMQDLAAANDRLEHDIARREAVESELALLANNATDAVFRLDREGTCLYASPSSQEVLGIAADRLVGRKVLNRLHVEDADHVGACFDALIRGDIERMTISYRAQSAKHTGSWVWLEAVCGSLNDAGGGSPIGIIASLRDVTDRKKLEEQLGDERAHLAEQHRLLMMAEDVGQVGHWRFEVAAQSVFWSDVVCAIQGVPAGFSPSLEDAVEIYHPDDRPLVAAHVQRALVDGTPYEFDARIIRPSGEERLVLSRGRAERGTGGDVIALFGVLQDVTDIRRSEQALKDLNQRMADNNRMLVMAEAVAHLGHWRVDARTNAYVWSDEVYRIHGLPADYQPDFENALATYHEDDRDRVRAIVEHAFATGQAYHFRARIHRPDGSEVSIFIRGDAERDEAGSVVGLFGIVQDISEQVEAEARLRDAQHRAETAATAKAIFLANMSHEIRTPMNGVVGFTDLLLAGNLSAEQRHQAELIAESGRAMMRLLNDILDLSKVEAGQMQIADEPFDLPHTLKACLKLITPAIAQKGVGLECELAHNLPKLVRGDGLRLRQIILNLLGNAAKFTSQGAIIVRAWPVEDSDPTKVVIEVEDSGIGIEPDRQAAIFEQFVQARSDITPRFGGTGLGLSISVQLARLMGGDISLESVPGQGTRFFLTLPLNLADDRRTSDRPETLDAQRDAVVFNRQRPLRVLVAEDHDVNQMLITAMLKQLGCKSAVAENGVQAVAMVGDAARNDVPYDVVLMDMQMPGMDGQEATVRIRRAGFDAATLPILALTANAYADDVAACLGTGMQAHLAKPLLLADLKAALKRWAHLPDALPKASHISENVRERYRIRKEATLHKVSELVRAGRFEDVELADIVDLLHKLAGSAGMFGEPELGRCAQELETGLLSWRQDELVEKAGHAVAALQAVA